MRPSTIRLIAGGVAIGGLIGLSVSATARADVVSDYATVHALDICGDLMRYPSVPGVVGSFIAAQQDGLTDVQSAVAVTNAVVDYCPQHVIELQRFIAIYNGKG